MTVPRSPAAPTGGANPVRILVVDDDPHIRTVVRVRLEKSGYRVWLADSGEAALTLIETRGLPHLAVVDVMMGGMNGFDFCERVQAWSDLPVILLTAVSEEATVVRGLRLFAEDYVTKPFRVAELEARVERVLRRIGDFTYAMDLVTRIDDRLAVDFAHQCAYVEKEPIDLTPTESKLLYILMRNAGRPVTHDFLLRRLWPHEERFEDVLRVHVYRLRKKIEPDTRNHHYIITERDLGYRFIAPA
jgi:DNA-binding response OmpR family regulator